MKPAPPVTSMRKLSFLILLSVPLNPVQLQPEPAFFFRGDFRFGERDSVKTHEAPGIPGRIKAGRLSQTGDTTQLERARPGHHARLSSFPRNNRDRCN